MRAATDARSEPLPPGQVARYYGPLGRKLVYYWRLWRAGWRVTLR